MKIQIMSIFLLFLLVGVTISRHIAYYSDPSGLQPILSTSQERRICAELCMSGLGGTPCGDECVDITPQGLPLQSASENTTARFSKSTRYESCSVLCENNLGYPLCYCAEKSTKTKADFLQVCNNFCVHYDYRIYGCQECSLYKNAPALNRSGSTRGLLLALSEPVVDWDLWCQKMCQDGDGGAACNCDLLPMSIKI